MEGSEERKRPHGSEYWRKEKGNEKSDQTNQASEY
jgi:hypothetical protein